MLTPNEILSTLFAKKRYLDFYIGQVNRPDLSPSTAVDDFLSRSLTEDLSQTPFFNPLWFRTRYRYNGGNSFIFYISQNELRLAKPSPMFLPRWYARQYSKAYLDFPFIDYLLYGIQNNPHPLIDSDFIGSQMIRPSDMQVFDYLTDKSLFLIDPHPYFKGRWYLDANPDVAAAGQNPLVHYLLYGDDEGRAPNRFFNVAWYKSTVSKHFNKPRALDLLTDYVIHGKYKGYTPAPGLEELGRITSAKSSVVPDLYGHCVLNDRNIYANLRRPPRVLMSIRATFMPRSIDYYNANVENNLLLLPVNKVAVLYTPKCGSSSIVYWWLGQAGLLDVALRFSGWSHDFVEIYKKSEEYFNAALGFTPAKYSLYKFVRDPIYRCLSSFRQYLRFPSAFDVPVTRKTISFLQFLEEIVSTNFFNGDEHFAMQVTLLEKSGAKPLIYKIEDGVDQCLRHLEARHSMTPVRLGHYGIIARLIQVHRDKTVDLFAAGPSDQIPFGKTPDYTLLINKETLSLIRTIYMEDCALYKY